MPGTESSAAGRRSNVTQLLEEARAGDSDSVERLIASVYTELRKTAASLLRSERSGHTLQITDLVHESYFRLFGSEELGFRDRGHFFGSAAVAMRRVLVDHARRKGAGKRIPKDELIPLDQAVEPATPEGVDLVSLDEALDRLAQVSPRQAEIVQLRYFGGLTESEVAEVLETSRATVSREWKVARLWLRREMANS